MKTDITVTLGANSVILSADPHTEAGRKWMDGRWIAGLPYAVAFSNADGKCGGLTIDAVEQDTGLMATTEL